MIVSTCILMPLAVAALAAATDLWKQRIPNLLTLPATLAGLAVHALGLAEAEFLNGWTSWRFSLVGFAVGFGLMLIVSLISNGGGGDVKLAGALGAFLGPGRVFMLLGVTFVSACVVLVSYFILRDGVFSTLRLLTATRKANDTDKSLPTTTDQISLPMGPFFLLGTIVIALLE